MKRKVSILRQEGRTVSKPVDEDQREKGDEVVMGFKSEGTSGISDI